MGFDDLTRTALIRGAIAFAVVLVVGSAAVFTSGHLRAASGQPSPTPVSSTPVQPPATGTPEAWLAWVPGGLPDGFGSSITAIPAIGAVMVSRACSPAVLRPFSFFTGRMTMVYRSTLELTASLRAASKSEWLGGSPAASSGAITPRGSTPRFAQAWGSQRPTSSRGRAA